MKSACPATLMILLALRAAADPLGPVIIPRTDSPPTLDGNLSDACWSNALHLTDFTEPLSPLPPAQPTEALLCFTDRALHIAFVCFVSDPGKIVANQTRQDLWLDCSVELWIKSTDDITEHDQFIVNSASARELIRRRSSNLAGLPPVPDWQAHSTVASVCWISEISIPFRDLGRHQSPVAGDVMELKLGREDYVDSRVWGEAALSVWPPGASYQAIRDYRRVYFERANLLHNPDLAASAPDGTAANWEISGTIRAAREAEQPIMVMEATAVPARMEQGVKLPAGQLCRLAVESRGSSGGRLRAKSRSGESQAVELVPSTTWTPHAVSFIPKESEPWYIVVETTPTAAAGEFALRGLSLTREFTADTMGPAIPVPVNTAQPTVITHIPVADIRAVRGFFGLPIDGTLDSRDYSGQRWEYNLNGEQANAAVRYLFRNNDGLHVTLADDRGVDAIQVRGGVHADVVVDARHYDDPASGQLVHTFPGKANNSLANFAQRIPAARFSFFNVHDGYIADLGFFRQGDDAAPLGTPERFGVSSAAGPDFQAPSTFTERFAAGQRTAWIAEPGTHPQEKPLALPRDTAVHVWIGPFDSERAVVAIGIEGRLMDPTTPLPLMLQVQDFLHPRTAVSTVMLELAGPGELRLVLDMPDQMLPAGQRLWLTLTARNHAVLAAPTIALYTAPRDHATPRALDYRLTKLKGFWSVMSEVRPWNVMPANTDVDAWLAGLEPYWRQCTIEIRDAIDHCNWLDPDHPLVAQYRDWFYRSRNRPALPPPRLPAGQDAPEWAIVARTAWLEARRVAGWWLEHRLVPSGEFGGSDDDGSLYQNFANFPLFESDGIGGALKVAAAARAELDQSARMDQGLGRTPQDPLHAYEEGLNQAALVTRWHYGDPVYLERCMQTTRSLAALTMVNAAGHRHFRGDIVGASMLHGTNQPVNFDSGFQAQLVHPVCELALYNQNPRALQFLRELGEAWLDHIAQSPPGQYPLSIDVMSDQPVEVSPEPFAGGFGCHASLMTFLTRMTGDFKFVQPLVDYYASGAYPEFTLNYVPDLYQLGALDHAPAAVQNQLANAPHLAWLATGDMRPLLDALRGDIAELQTFPHLYTTAEPFTDRVFLYAAFNAARAYTGGFATRNKTYHSHAVSWEGLGTNFAALVRTARPDRLQALVYNFNDSPAAGVARFWLLNPGRYAFTLDIDANGDHEADTRIASNVVDLVRGEALPFVLPPRQVAALTLTQLERLEPLVTTRADLALSPRKLVVVDGTVAGLVHNVGAADVTEVVVSLLDAQGAVRQQAALGPLDAPLDLEPRRLPFRFTDLPEAHAGWRVVVDPDQLIPEITEGNNAVTLTPPAAQVPPGSQAHW